MDNSQNKVMVENILNQMSEAMGEELPNSIKLASEVMPEMVIEHAQNNGFAMPKEGGFLDNETRTLIYLGIALATNSTACIKAMMNKAIKAGISKERILETVKIARFAEATRVIGNAEEVFKKLK